MDFPIVSIDFPMVPMDFPMVFMASRQVLSRLRDTDLAHLLTEFDTGCPFLQKTW